MTSSGNGQPEAERVEGEPEREPVEKSEQVVDPNERAVVRRDSMTVSALQVERGLMQNVQAWGRAMYASRLFPDVKSANQALVKILAGRENGFSVTASMSGIHIIDGKPTMGAGLMAHAIKASGKYDYRVKEHTDERCVLIFRERISHDQWHEAEVDFTLADAERAGITVRSQRNPDQPSMWEKYPREMLFARAISRLVAWHAPDVFEGRVYTPDELRPDLELTAEGEIADPSMIVVDVPEFDEDEESTPPERPRGPVPPRSERARARQRKTPNATEVNDVQSLLAWQHGRHGLTAQEVSEALGVEATGKIAEKWKDRWPQAMGAITAYVEQRKRQPPPEPPSSPDAVAQPEEEHDDAEPFEELTAEEEAEVQQRIAEADAASGGGDDGEA